MPRPAFATRLLACALLCLARPTCGQWNPVAPGIDFQQFALADPNDVYVARMERANLGVTIDTVLGQGKLDDNSRETVSSMAARRDGSIGYWGQQWDSYTTDVKVAINGDFWDFALGMPESGHIQSGWYAKRYTNFTGGSGFAWTLDREVFIGGCVNHQAAKNFVAYPATGQSQNINAVNLPRGSDELVLYTPQFNVSTGTTAGGTEVLVKMARPTLVLPSPSNASGTVVEVRAGQGDTRVPFDHVVLSASGSAATKLAANVSVGAEIRISQEIKHYAADCSTAAGAPDWTKTYAAVGSSFDYLRDSVIDPHSGDLGATTRNPRTAIAFNSGYIYFIVVDGRRAGSVGMSMQELGEFTRDTLGATDGVNQDGGGSSAMWVDGAIVNVPSDGAERPTHNGLFMASLVVPGHSTALSTGPVYAVTAPTALRQGPGTNFGSFAALTTGTTALVVNHNLNGIEATGESWWLVDAGGTEGWLPESVLSNLTAADGWIMY